MSHAVDLSGQWEKCAPRVGFSLSCTSSTMGGSLFPNKFCKLDSCNTVSSGNLQCFRRKISADKMKTKDICLVWLKNNATIKVVCPACAPCFWWTALFWSAGRKFILYPSQAPQGNHEPWDTTVVTWTAIGNLSTQFHATLLLRNLSEYISADHGWEMGWTSD